MNEYNNNLKEFKDELILVWEEIKSLVYNTLNIIEDIERKSKYRRMWFVPRNTCREHQVLNKKPIVANIRSHI